VLVILYRQPGANIIDTVDRVMALLPELHASISPAIDIDPAVDRSTTIRASLAEVERTLMIAVVLVVLVVFVFLRSGQATMIPSVAVPVSLIGTFGVMYLLGYSLDNLSLMALTIATGFVVDDAIVVLENISRHIEAGVPRVRAAVEGAAEVSFTVLSMSISLIAVFIPILLMGGIIGRLFREFAVTLSIAILVSLAVSLTTTPMMCAFLLRRPQREGAAHWRRRTERSFEALQRGYARSLAFALNHRPLIVLILAVTLCLNFYLYVSIPKGFFPQQDTGRINGSIQADQSISFQLMRQKLQEFISIIRRDPAVDTVVGFTGTGPTNGGFIFMSLKPLSKRKISADRVVRRLRGEIAQVPGASLFLRAVQDIRVGGRAANAQYQYTLQADNAEELFAWAPKILAEMEKIPQMAQVNSDQQNKGLETDITIDRDTAARLGINVAQIDSTLYDAFGQRQVSTIYNPRNQYHVVMEASPQYWQNAESLKDVYVSQSGGTPRGTQTTNAVAGTVTGPPAPAGSSCPSPTTALASSSTTTTPTGGATSTIGTTGQARTTSATATTNSSGIDGTTTNGTPTTTGAAITAGAASATGTTTTGSTINTTTFTPQASSTPMPAASATLGLPSAAGGCTTATSSSASASASAAAAVATDAVRNQALNSIGNTGHSAASAGAAVSTSAETMIPLSAVTRFGPGNIPLVVNHQGPAIATTISFNLAPSASLGDAVREVGATMRRLGVPSSIRGTFQGTARAFEQSLANEPYLIVAAIIAIYIVLGILYESYIHPLTILSTLPSAGVGAVLALMLFNTDFSVMALIGVILLIGIVKKNAIMMIDFALDAERTRNLSSEQAIYEACLLRFRPIMMTTAAALLGALPLVIAMGEGSELRRPLGIAVVGGLIVSQMLTLYTTPVIYLYLDRFDLWLRSIRTNRSLAPG
jgi:multidrug efflux pump